MLLAHVEVPHVLGSVIVNPCAIANDLSVLEQPFELVSVPHDEDALAILLTLFEVALVLEEWVRVSVTPVALSEFCNWIDVAHVTVLGGFVFSAVLHHHFLLAALHLRLVLHGDVY